MISQMKAWLLSHYEHKGDTISPQVPKGHTLRTTTVDQCLNWVWEG